MNPKIYTETLMTDEEIVALYWQGLSVHDLAVRVKGANGYKSLGGAREKVEKVLYDELMKESV